MDGLFFILSNLPKINTFRGVDNIAKKIENNKDRKLNYTELHKREQRLVQLLSHEPAVQIVKPGGSKFCHPFGSTPSKWLLRGYVVIAEIALNSKTGNRGSLVRI